MVLIIIVIGAFPADRILLPLELAVADVIIVIIGRAGLPVSLNNRREEKADQAKQSQYLRNLFHFFSLKLTSPLSLISSVSDFKYFS